MKYWKQFFCLLLTLTLLIGCGNKETERLIKAVPLSKEEIEQVNKALSAIQEDNGTTYSTEVSCFFTSYYDKVEELDFKNFLLYFPSSEYIESNEEFSALADLPEFPWKGMMANNQPVSSDMLPVPIRRISEEAVDAVLTKWAGITQNDIANKSGVLYLEDHHAFYTFTSDFGPGQFICTGGEVKGNTARLWSDSNNEGESRDLLTLEQKDGNWYIHSFQTVPSITNSFL